MKIKNCFSPIRCVSLPALRFQSSAAALVLVLIARTVSAQLDEQQGLDAPGPEAQQEASDSDELALQQQRIADKYAQLEQLIIRRAELETSSNPQRAALLKRAAQTSADRFTRRQLQEIAELLAQQQLKEATDQQASVHADLQALLKLLLTEDRADRLKDEQQRIKDYIKEVERLQRLQGSTRGRTEGGSEPRELSKEQAQIADRAGNLADRIRENEEGAAAAGDEQQDEDSSDQDRPPSENGDQQSDSKEGEEPQPGQEGKQGQQSQGEQSEQEGEPSESQPSDGDPAQPAQQSQSQPGAPSEQDGAPQQGQPSQSPPQQGQPGQQPPQQQSGENQQPAQDQAQSNPVRQRIEAAEQRMREAQERLDEAQRKEAVEQQLAAEEELRKAKAELEEILRQLREEEVERMLALLEGRFRKMLEMQLQVYEGTVELAEESAGQQSREVDIQASRLSVDERKIVLEADRALTLLIEEGSSISFPEVVREMRDNMQQVVDRLARGKIDTITQATEEDIIQALEEMIAALEKAQKDLEQQQQQQQQQGQPQLVEPPLVDQLAELRMIRALQMRVNTRTQRYAQLLDDVEDLKGQATDVELRDALRQLAQREQRIHQITRDIVLGKNK